MKIYISQPKINDRSIMEVVNEYVELMEIFKKQYPEYETYSVYMIDGSLIQRIEYITDKNTDVVLFASNFLKDRDCVVDETCAKVYGKKCFYYISSISKFIAAATEDLSRFD